MTHPTRIRLHGTFHLWVGVLEAWKEKQAENPQRALHTLCDRLAPATRHVTSNSREKSVLTNHLPETPASRDSLPSRGNPGGCHWREQRPQAVLRKLGRNVQVRWMGRSICGNPISPVPQKHRQQGKLPLRCSRCLTGYAVGRIADAASTRYLTRPAASKPKMPGSAMCVQATIHLTGGPVREVSEGFEKGNVEFGHIRTSGATSLASLASRRVQWCGRCGGVPACIGCLRLQVDGLPPTDMPGPQLRLFCSSQAIVVCRSRPGKPSSPLPGVCFYP